MAAAIPLVLFSHSGLSETLDREIVIERLIESYGGEKNLRKLDAVVQEWGFVALMGNRHGTDIRSIRMPDRLKVELRYPNKMETRFLDGDSAWVVFDEKEAAEATQAQRDAMRLQLMRLYSPLALRDKSDAVTLVVDGGFCALSLIENGVQADYLVNRETWRIESVVGSLKVKGGQMQFLTEYSDFKFVDGALIHQKENKFAGGVNTAKLLLRRVILDPDLEEGTFVPR